MATGLSKTTVVALDVKRFLQKQPESRVLFLCHQNDILEQARNRFEEIVGSDYTYGNFTGEGARDYDSVTCLFASFQVMRDWKEAFIEEEFDYIIVDESHHAKATTSPGCGEQSSTNRWKHCERLPMVTPTWADPPRDYPEGLKRA